MSERDSTFPGLAGPGKTEKRVFLAGDIISPAINYVRVLWHALGHNVSEATETLLLFIVRV